MNRLLCEKVLVPSFLRRGDQGQLIPIPTCSSLGFGCDGHHECVLAARLVVAVKVYGSPPLPLCLPFFVEETEQGGGGENGSAGALGALLYHQPIWRLFYNAAAGHRYVRVASNMDVC